ncbi:hypothetical protein LPB87_09440 [Flavobacterium sp. EDS]|uniref:hypothetical protein n=1 Tax=Flavobacterium sp. EDS TaxID=2897328 RepID=UPI001E33CE51|nr:hypothetical protein [Flavobacterium sp. EDS]MCD0474612.1 hypothetical protein [Flavobacterium sp. EDS]
MSKQFLEEEIYNLAGEDLNSNLGGEAPEDDEQLGEEKEEKIVDIDKGGKGEGYSAS